MGHLPLRPSVKLDSAGIFGDPEVRIIKIDWIQVSVRRITPNDHPSKPHQPVEISRMDLRHGSLGFTIRG